MKSQLHSGVQYQLRIKGTWQLHWCIPWTYSRKRSYWLGLNDSCSPSSLHFSFLSFNKLIAAGGVFVQDAMASFDQQLSNLPAWKSTKLCWLYKMFSMHPRTRNTASKAVEPPLPESYVFMHIPSAEDGNCSWYPEPSLIFHPPGSFMHLNTLHLTQRASIVTETPKGNKATVSSFFWKFLTTPQKSVFE